MCAYACEDGFLALTKRFRYIKPEPLLCLSAEKEAAAGEESLVIIIVVYNSYITNVKRKYAISNLASCKAENGKIICCGSSCRLGYG